ncbi:hypothetical protein DITRI_Ditri07aG0056500 [Diplodiscus trichospermus]
MDEKHRICKICNRRFANGKAMGGHMRSHLAKLPIPPKLNLPSSSSTPPKNIINSPPPSALSCPTSEVNHMQPYGSINHEISSEVKSPSNPTQRRSKRIRKFASNMVGSSSNSVSFVVVPVSDETVSSEEAAMCLLMLANDKWIPNSNQEQKEVDVELLDLDFDDETNDESNGDNLICVTKSKTQKYKCETCNKVFKSHQALGGHRTGHNYKSSGYGQRRFECPFCDKVFESGQALGGHKKSHFSYLPVAPNKISRKSVELFDLNLPASDDEEVSLVEHSTEYTVEKI